jgi:hypothetical protein
MHELRINISVKPKIMINLPEVCFDITRQHAQVGHKNLISFGYKNHLGSAWTAASASGGASSRRRRQWHAADRGVLGREPQLRAFIADTRAPW